jgi:hypothetical protein
MTSPAPRVVHLDPARYGVRPGFTFRKWGAERALGVFDWVVAAYGPDAAESVAEAVRGLIVGQIDAAAAGRAIGKVLRAHGNANAWGAFLDMAAVDEATGAGLWRNGNKAPVWSADPARQQALKAQGQDPDTVFADAPLEPLMLIVAMLAETFAPFGRAWDFVAPLFSTAETASPTPEPSKPTPSRR